MTERLATVERRIGSVRQLEAVVTAMRGIALSRAQQSKSQLVSIRAFSRIIAEAIGQALSLSTDEVRHANRRQSKPALILFCAEQGFAGPLSDRVLDEAQRSAAGADLFLIGSRGLTLAEHRQVSPVWHAAMAPHMEGLPALANSIADALYARIATTGFSRVAAIFPCWSDSGRLSVETRRLLPFDFGRFPAQHSAVPPLTTLPADILLSRLSEEYVFAEICEIATIAFAAENEARMAAMVGAKRNIERIRGDLESLARQVRQEEITAELTELSAAASP